MMKSDNKLLWPALFRAEKIKNGQSQDKINFLWLSNCFGITQPSLLGHWQNKETLLVSACDQ